MLQIMKPIQVYVTDRDLAALKAWARARHASVSDVVRGAVHAIVHSQERDPFLAAIGMLSGLGNASVDHDRLIVEAEERVRGEGKAKHRRPNPVRGHRGMARTARSG